jgi:hypothetical protein
MNATDIMKVCLVSIKECPLFTFLICKLLGAHLEVVDGHYPKIFCMFEYPFFVKRSIIFFV